MRVKIGDAEVEVTGPPSYVNERIAQFMQQAPGPTKRAHAVPDGGTGDPAIVNKKGTSPAQFIKRANTKSDVNAVLVAGYYLERINGQESFTAQEIRDVLGKAKRPPPTNINDSINGNIKKGLIMSAGDRDSRMAFVLTSDGEDAVQAMVQTGG